MFCRLSFSEKSEVSLNTGIMKNPSHGRVGTPVTFFIKGENDVGKQTFVDARSFITRQSDILIYV